VLGIVVPAITAVANPKKNDPIDEATALVIHGNLMGGVLYFRIGRKP
jgi:hypothetical protein